MTAVRAMVIVFSGVRIGSSRHEAVHSGMGKTSTSRASTRAARSPLGHATTSSTPAARSWGSSVSNECSAP